MTTNDPGSTIDTQIDGVRIFNRFYTKRIGLLDDGFLRSPFSLAEVRILYELAHLPETTAAELSRELGFTPGYLSRLHRGLRKRGLIEARPSETDRRERLLSLTDAGRRVFAELDDEQRRDVERLLDPLDPSDRIRLLASMRTVAGLLGAPPEPRAPWMLRSHEPGDIGWVVHRHGVLYHREYGWNEEFEALVARIAYRFIQRFDPARERCWIAEVEGERVGSVFLVRHPKRRKVARLRLLLVEPKARGLGIGRRLVQECTRFARGAGYTRITLWTNNVLLAARRIYEEEGYRLVEEEEHRSYGGHDLVGQNWELRL